MISSESHGNLALLRLDHGKANALDVELADAIAAAIGSARDADGIVLTGSGKIFSAGVDLKRLVDGGAAYAGELLPAIDRAFEAVFMSPRPIVAALNGHAIAGGCILAAACDYRVIVDAAVRIGIPEMQVGVPFPPIAIEILRSAMSPQTLQRYAVFGRTVTPAEALREGLVDEVAAADQLLDRAVAVAKDLGGIRRKLFELTRLLIRQPSIERARASKAAWGAEIDEVWRSAETLEVLRRYVDTMRK